MAISGVGIQGCETDQIFTIHTDVIQSDLLRAEYFVRIQNLACNWLGLYCIENVKDLTFIFLLVQLLMSALKRIIFSASLKIQTTVNINH